MPQRIQTVSSGLNEMSSLNSRMPELSLVIGALILTAEVPIIGPPKMILPISAGLPCTLLMRNDAGVPMRTIKLEGVSAASPLTVTTRSNNGLFFLNRLVNGIDRADILDDAADIGRQFS